MADPTPPARLTMHHQVVINLLGYLVCADWRTPNCPMARAEIAARLPQAPLTGQPQVDAVLAAAALIDTGPASLLRARDAFAAFLFWRAAQAQVAADAPNHGAENVA